MPEYKCRRKRCQHKWKSNRSIEEIIICPKCKSPYWNRDPKNIPWTDQEKAMLQQGTNPPRRLPGACSAMRYRLKKKKSEKISF